MHILETLLGLFKDYGYWVVFFGVMLENAGLPVPGETILLAAGFFASDGSFRLPVVMSVAAFGAIIGDNIGFAIGRRFGRGLLISYGKFFFLTKRRLVKMTRFFESHGDKTILVARFITGLRVFAAILAGASDMPWPRFVIYNATGALLWATVIATVGYFFGSSWPLLEKWVGRSGMVLLVVALVALVISWKVKKAAQERRRELKPRRPGALPQENQ